MEEGYCGAVCWEEVCFEEGSSDGGNNRALKGEDGGSLKNLVIHFGLLFMAGEAGTDWDLFFF